MKKLEAKGLVKRSRSVQDERNLVVTITEKGEQLKEKAVTIPENMVQCTNLEPEEAMLLYKLLYKILNKG